MSVNSNPTTCQQNMKKHSHLSPVSLLSNISAKFQKNLKWPHGILGARGKLIYEKNLKSKISCQTPFNETQIILGY
jgi:hypothetical protein